MQISKVAYVSTSCTLPFVARPGHQPYLTHDFIVAEFDATYSSAAVTVTKNKLLQSFGTAKESKSDAPCT